jgi:LVIVD repeat-containing protein
MRLALALALVLALPGQALAETSPGVSLVGSIPERGVISAKAVGQDLYVSAVSGVSIYDISNPRAPVRVGRLELPNAQNEDVDVGSGIMLVSDDPFGGRGALHVIDVRDRANPRLLSSFRTWTPGVFDFRSPPRRRGIGHTATCIQDCRYAWLAGSPAGIDVVDLRDPARPRLARRFSAREAAGEAGTHDVQVDGSGLAWVAGGNGTAAYDVSNPLRPRLVKRTNRRGSRPPLNDLIHHNSLRLRRDVVAITEEAFGAGCRGAGTLQTWRISGRRRMTPMDSFGVERDRSSALLCSAHYFDARDGLIAQGFYEQGVRLIDARRPGRLRQVGYYVSRPGLFWGALFAPTDPAGSTVYALDHSRGIDVLALDRTALRPVRRTGSRRRGRVTDFGLFVDDGFDSVRPGQRLRLQISVFGRGGSADVQVTLPPELVDVRPPRGVSFDAATRTVRFSIRRLDGGTDRVVRARVARSARGGTQLESIGYVSGAGDPLPLDDRGVDRGVVARRARATSAAAFGLCSLASDYTL